MKECPAGTILGADQPDRDLLPLPDLIRPQADYEERVSRIESEAGAFAYDLVPELIGLALLHREDGGHLEALNLLQRAFYIVRINDGLYSLSQIPLLELLIQSQGALGRWKTVADEYDHLYWLYRRAYGSNDVRILPFLKRLRQWHMDAYNKDTGRSLEVHFNAAKAIYNQAMEILIACGEDEKIALCFWNEACCTGVGKERGSCPADNS